MEKKLKDDLATICESTKEEGKPLRLIFQDEARFGRMVRLRRCWSPMPHRPVVFNGYQREYTYLYGAVSPLDGTFEHMISESMNTVKMGEFLAQVAAAHADELVVMVVDGASSHTSKELLLPSNVRLLRLPPYSPELNPCENIWLHIRSRFFPNRIYPSMDKVKKQLSDSLPVFSSNKKFIKRVTAWNWIIDAIINAC
jgi:transposase